MAIDYLNESPSPTSEYIKLVNHKNLHIFDQCSFLTSYYRLFYGKYIAMVNMVN